jgi:hypothetical protein
MRSVRQLGGRNNLPIVSIVVHLVAVLLLAISLIIPILIILLTSIATISTMSMSALSMSIGIIPSMVSASIAILIIVLRIILGIVLSIIPSNNASIPISTTPISTSSNNRRGTGNRCRWQRRRHGASRIVIPLIIECGKVVEGWGGIQIQRRTTTTTTLHHHYRHDSSNESNSDDTDRDSDRRSVGSVAGLRGVLVAVKRILRVAGVTGGRWRSRRLVATAISTIAVTATG